MFRKRYPEASYVEINPAAADRYGIRAGDRVAVSSQRGRIVAKAFLTPGVKPGQVFMPMHYPITNLLTHPFYDPYSQQPDYKTCAVKISREATVA